MEASAGARGGEAQRRPGADGDAPVHGGGEAEGLDGHQEAGGDRQATCHRGHKEETMVRRMWEGGDLLLLLEYIVLRLPLPASTLAISHEFLCSGRRRWGWPTSRWRFRSSRCNRTASTTTTTTATCAWDSLPGRNGGDEKCIWTWSSTSNTRTWTWTTPRIWNGWHEVPSQAKHANSDVILKTVLPLMMCRLFFCT